MSAPDYPSRAERDEQGTVCSIITEIAEAGRQKGRVSVGDIAEAFGPRGVGPFIMIPALLEMTPVGSIPTVPTMIATLIGLFALQILVGRPCLWLPGFVRRRNIDGDRLERYADALRPVAARLDRWFHRRLPSFTGPKADKMAAVAILALCLTVPPLELFPMASTVPMAAIAALGLAMMVEDGMLMAIGFALALAAFVVVPVVAFAAVG